MQTPYALAAAALALIAAGASAQDAAPDPAAAPPAAEAPGADAPPPAPAADTAPAPAADAASAAAPAAPAANAGAAATVQADWAKYDKGNKGSLTALEFGSWILAARGQDMTAQVEKTKTSKKADLPAVKVLNATVAEFLKADKDGSKSISPDELTAYLSA